LVGQAFGRFRVVRRIGAGGMGVVYEAVHAERNVSVAIKTLERLDPDAIYRLKAEFRSLAGVSHPNLVKMHELACVDHRWFFAMDYIDGVPFVEYVRAGLGDAAPPAGHARLRSSLGQLIAGLHALHTLGKIHRDIKPPNVLVTGAGRVVVLDFGLSLDAKAAMDQSASGFLFGTPLYMAPEVFLGDTAGPAADWYAVGVMLYEALAGSSPGVTRKLMSMKLLGSPTPPRDLDPSVPPDLNELCLRLLSREPFQRPTGADLAAMFSQERERVAPSQALAAESRAPFVGRKSELAALRVARERAAGGRTAIASISGESGIGKSALVDAFLREPQRDPNTLILYGRCYEHESVPYKAFDQIVDALSHYLNVCGEVEAASVMPLDPSALTTLFPVLGRVPAVQALPARPLPSDPAELRLRGFGAFGELLRRLGERRHLLLVIDDLQWSDADSALLFKDILGGANPPACLLVVTSRQARPDALRGLFSPAADSRGIELVELRLSGLSAQEASELAAHFVGTGHDGGLTSKVIADEAAGNPFFVVALARSAAHATTPSLRTLMQSSVRALPSRAAEMLKVIAVAGQPVDEAAVAAVVGVADGSPDLSLLAAGHFISAWPTSSRCVECYHDRIRESVVAELGEDELRAVHGRLARALEDAKGSDPQQLAIHFLAAGEVDRGSEYAERAADEARQALAFLDAARWYERALRGAASNAERTRHLQTQLGEAFAGAGRGREAAEWLLEAARAAPLGTALKLRQRAAELLLVSGHIDEGVRVLETVLNHVRMRLAPTPQRALASLLWNRARLRARGLGFVERKAEELSEAQLLKIDACWSVGVGLSLVDIIRGADFQTRHVILALDGGEPYRVARALAMEAGSVSAPGKTPPSARPSPTPGRRSASP